MKNRSHHPIVRDSLDAILLDKWFHMPRYRSRLRRVVQHVLAALVTGDDVETFALTRFPFWYKAFFLTPHGALKVDTTGELCERTAFARRVVQDRSLCRVPVGAVMANWHAKDLWEKSRPLAAILLQQWRKVMNKPSPLWVEQGRPEPEPGAFRALIARMAVRRCCPYHAREDAELKAAWQAPAGPCVLCGAPGTWRQGWPPPSATEPVATPCRSTTEGTDQVRYVDLCETCRHAADVSTRIEQTLQRRQARWN